MATGGSREEEKAILLNCVHELRRLYDHVTRSFEQLRNKSLALLVGEVAIVTFLFSDNLPNKLLHHSQPSYGVVIFGLGTALLIFSFVTYLAVISTITWVFPTEEYDMKNPTDRFKGDHLEFLKYLHAEYMTKIPVCIAKSKQRSDWFMMGTYALSAGIFFITLVKYGGGA